MRRCIKDLARAKLIVHDNKKYDGYTLTYKGYDYLALKALVNRGHISAIGNQIGCGKESDLFQVMDDEGRVFCLKLHRLGRTSFRSIKINRDYLEGRHRTNWFYMSRIAALKEFSYMKALHDRGFEVPVPVDVNRHAVLMSVVDGLTLSRVRELPSARKLLSKLMDFLFRLTSVGLVHCDFNEYNIMVDSTGEKIVVIDFPQMVSTSHLNAMELFKRDVDGLQIYFAKKFAVEASWKPEDLPQFERPDEQLDKELRSSGFSAEQQEEFDSQMHEMFKKAAEEEALEEGGDSAESGSGSDIDSMDSDGEEEGEEEDDEEQEAREVEIPEWVSRELEEQLAAQVAASLTADESKSEKVEEAAALAASSGAAVEMQVGETEEEARTAKDKARMKRKVKKTLDRKRREQPRSKAVANRNKQKGRQC